MRASRYVRNATAVVAVIAVGALTISAPTARATEEPAGPGASTKLSISVESGRAARTTIRQGARYLNCAVTVNSPHYSRGAKGVIAKIRYSCSGNVNGTLSLSGYMKREEAGRVRAVPAAGFQRGDESGWSRLKWDGLPAGCKQERHPLLRVS